MIKLIHMAELLTQPLLAIDETDPSSIKFSMKNNSPFVSKEDPVKFWSDWDGMINGWCRGILVPGSGANSIQRIFISTRYWDIGVPEMIYIY